MSWSDKVNNVLGACTSGGAFGEFVIHTPTVGAAQSIRGIWSDVYLTVEPDTGIQIMSGEPNIGARLLDFETAPKKDDIIIRRGVNYRIRVPEPDGEGGVTLVLEKVK